MQNKLTSDTVIQKTISLAERESTIEALWLYGSRAQGAARSGSDYDFAVLFDSWLDNPLDQQLRPEELRIEWSRKLTINEQKLSLVDIQLVPIPLAWEVLSKGKLLLCKNEDQLIYAELKIMSLYELDVCYHRKCYG